MIIDKVAAFYTEQDHAELAKHDARIAEIEAAAAELAAAAHATDDKALFMELIRQSNEMLKSVREEEQAKREIKKQIEQRYIDTFNGNIAGIIANVREIVDAITKEDYISYQKRLTAALKPLIDVGLIDDSEEEKIWLNSAKKVSVRGWENCYYYIIRALTAQENALIYYSSNPGAGEAYEEFIAIVEAKADSFYKRPKKNKPDRPLPKHDYTPPISEAGTRGTLLTMPSSPALSLWYEIIGSGGNLERMADRKKKYNRNTSLVIEENGARRRISQSKAGNAFTIEIDDFRKLTDRNPQIKKILTRVIIETNRQAIRNGQLMRDEITFPLQGLVGEGQYKNLDTARKGFLNAMATLRSVTIVGAFTKGKKKTVQSGEVSGMFRKAKVNQNTCVVLLEDQFNWELITAFYTGLPDYYFELPDRAAELLEYIFYIARQNARKIAEQGFFTIGFRAIQARLNLPSEIDENGRPINNPKRDIKDAIEMAVEQVKEKHKKYSTENMEFVIEVVADYGAPIKSYLDNGYLKIYLKGNYAARFIEISQKSAAQIEAAIKREEKIQDQAKAKNLAEAMKKKGENS